MGRQALQLFELLACNAGPFSFVKENGPLVGTCGVIMHRCETNSTFYL